MDEILRLAIRQDLENRGDITTDSLFSKDFKAAAEIRVKDVRLKKRRGILAGMAELKKLASGFGIEITGSKKDGSKIRFGERVCMLEGGIKRLMTIERTALNLVCRMSGIATAVHRLSKSARIAATRKSPPGLMELDKKAVKIGGGLAHRAGLWAGILIKDNHIFALQKSEHIDKESAIAEAIRRCSKRRPVEIEVSNQKEAKIAYKARADIVMLDNFSPMDAKRAVSMLRKLDKKVKIELSGGVNEGNIKEYAKAGADYISMGWITNSAMAVDMNMKLV